MYQYEYEKVLFIRSGIKLGSAVVFSPNDFHKLLTKELMKDFVMWDKQQKATC